MSKNRVGTVYPYFICLGRHQKTTDCLQRAVLISVVERKVEEHYDSITLDAASRAAIGAVLTDEFHRMQQASESASDDLTTQKQRLAKEQLSLLQAHYAGAVPLDLLKSEQDRISRELTSIDQRLTAASAEFDHLEHALQRALDLAATAHGTYRHAPARERRLLNQAFFTRILVVDEDTIEAELAEPFKTILKAARPREHPEPVLTLTDAIRRENEKPATGVASLKLTTLVRLRESLSSNDSAFTKLVRQGQPDLPIEPESPQLKRGELRSYRQLSDTDLKELATLYEAGETTAFLAQKFECHRHTVMRALQKAGIVRRPQKLMTADLVAQAAALYASDHTLEDIAKLFGLEASTIGKALKRSGVRLRPPVADRWHGSPPE